MGFSCWSNSTKDEDIINKQERIEQQNKSTSGPSSEVVPGTGNKASTVSTTEKCSLSCSLRNLFKRNKKSKINISAPIPIEDGSHRLSTELVKVDHCQINNNHAENCIDNEQKYHSQIPDDIDNHQSGSDCTEKQSILFDGRIVEPIKPNESKEALSESQIRASLIESKLNEYSSSTELPAEFTHNLWKYENEQRFDIENLLQFDWFWGSITRREAEMLLRKKEDGTFLVRESSDFKFKYSLSFRSGGKTMHSRIHCSKDGQYSFYSPKSQDSTHDLSFSTLSELINSAISEANSSENIFFYSRGDSYGRALNMMSLAKAMSRPKYLIQFPYKEDEHKALQYMSLFVLKHSNSTEKESILQSSKDRLNEEMKDFIENAALFPQLNFYAS